MLTNSNLPSEFSADVESLPIAQKAKRVVETFLELECTPGINLSPRRAKWLRECFLGVIESCAEVAFDEREFKTAPTISVAHEIESLHQVDHRSFVSIKLLELADMLRAIASEKGRGKRVCG